MAVCRICPPLSGVPRSHDMEALEKYKQKYKIKDRCNLNSRRCVLLLTRVVIQQLESVGEHV